MRAKVSYLQTLRYLLVAISIIFFPTLGGAQTAEHKIKIVASFSILGDWAKQIGGESVEVRTIVGPNSDAHVFQPTPETLKMLVDADIVIINGLGFEGWIERLIASSGFKGPVIVASQGITPRMDQDGNSIDPHAWHSVSMAKIYVHNIAEALGKHDPDPKHVAKYEERAQIYMQQLDNLDQWIQQVIQTTPEERRKIITAHDGFQYFSLAYGVVFLAPQGLSTESEPTATQVASLIKQIRQQGIHTLFIENMANPRLIQQIANETGIRVLGPLYSDALSEVDEPADTYLNMMKHNVTLMVEAIKN